MENNIIEMNEVKEICCSIANKINSMYEDKFKCEYPNLNNKNYIVANYCERKFQIDMSYIINGRFTIEENNKRLYRIGFVIDKENGSCLIVDYNGKQYLINKEQDCYIIEELLYNDSLTNRKVIEKYNNLSEAINYLIIKFVGPIDKLISNLVLG